MDVASLTSIAVRAAPTLRTAAVALAILVSAGWQLPGQETGPSRRLPGDISRPAAPTVEQLPGALPQPVAEDPLANYQPWWDGYVMRPLSPERSALPLPVERVTVDTLAMSPLVRAYGDRVLIRRTAIEVSEATSMLRRAGKSVRDRPYCWPL